MDILDIKKFLYERYDSKEMVDFILDNNYKEILSYRPPYDIEIVYYSNSWSLEDTENYEVILDEEMFNLMYLPFYNDCDTMTLKQLIDMLDIEIDVSGNGNLDEDLSNIIHRENCFCLHNFIIYTTKDFYVIYDIEKHTLVYDRYTESLNNIVKRLQYKNIVLTSGENNAIMFIYENKDITVAE